MMLVYGPIFILVTYRCRGEYEAMLTLARTPRQIGNIVRRSRKAQGLNRTQIGRRSVCGKKRFP